MREYRERFALSLSRMLSDARIGAGMQQADLAARLHVGRRTIIRAELGDTTPKAAFVEKWLAACGVRCTIFTMELSPRQGEQAAITTTTKGPTT